MTQGVRWGGRVVTGMAALVLLTRCGGGASEGGPDCQESSVQEARVLACTPAADVYVEEGETRTVHSAERKLVADNLSRRSAYLRFEVPEPSGRVRRATLRLYAMDGSTDGPKLYPSATDWDERSLSGEALPALTGGLLGDADLVPNGSWVEYDVTAAVKGGGQYGFALVTESRNGVDFASKEHVRQEWAPRLVLTLEGSPSK